MSEIQISDIKYLVQENYISDEDGKKLESALKLQELVKERLKALGKDKHHSVMFAMSGYRLLKDELQSLVEESEK